MKELKQLKIWVNEEQYQQILNDAQKKGLTLYAYTKQLILNRRITAMNVFLLFTYACSEAFWLFLCWQLLTKFLSILPSL